MKSGSALYFNVDPDPTFHSDADPESGSCFSSMRCKPATTGIGLQALHGSICEHSRLNFEPLRLQGEPPWLYFERPELPNFDFDADADLAFWLWCGSDSGFSLWCGSGSNSPKWCGSMRAGSATPVLNLIWHLPILISVLQTVSKRYIYAAYFKVWVTYAGALFINCSYTFPLPLKGPNPLFWSRIDTDNNRYTWRHTGDRWDTLPSVSHSWCRYTCGHTPASRNRSTDNTILLFINCKKSL